MTPRYMRLYEVAQVVPSKLVFVASALRSGSTLLRLMLNSHPRISSPGEFDFLFDSLGTDADRNKVHAFEANRFLAHLQQSRIFRSLEISLPDGEENCMGLIHRIVGQIAAGVDVLALNLHRNFVTARQVFPSASFIHLIRDPRDCAVSAVRMGLAGNVFYGLDPWIEAERSWGRVMQQMLASNYMELRFEDLVQDAACELKRICDFLDLSYDSRMLEFQHVSYNRPDARCAKQWQKALRPKEIRLIEGRVAALLQDRGYEKSGLPALRPNAFQAVGLALQNRIARNAFAIRRYGIALWAGEKTARWFRLKSRWALYKKEIDAIDTRYLK